MGLELAAVATVLGTTLGVVETVSSYNQQKANARAQEAMMDYNAKLEQREADAELQENNEQAKRQRTEDERLRSMQRAAYGKSGAAMTTGSPLAVLGETAGLQEMAVQDLHRSGAAAYNRRQAQANSYLYQGRVAGASVNGAMMGLGIGKTLIGGMKDSADVMKGYANDKSGSKLVSIFN